MSNVFHLDKRKNLRLKLLGEDYYPSCTAILSDMPMCHSGESQTESSALKRVDRDEQIKILDKMIEYIESEIRVVDSLINILKYQDQIIIQKRHFQNKKFEVIFDEVFGYSDVEYLKKAYYRAIREMEKEYNREL